jgi:hypothetical protein
MDRLIVAANVSVAHAQVANHDPLLAACGFGFVEWSRGLILFSKVTGPTLGGVNASSFGTVDFRVSRQCANPLDLLCSKQSNWFNFETNFSIRLVAGDGTLSNPVQLHDYLSLTGPVGSLVFGFGTAGHPNPADGAHSARGVRQ